MGGGATRCEQTQRSGQPKSSPAAEVVAAAARRRSLPYGPGPPLLPSPQRRASAAAFNGASGLSAEAASAHAELARRRQRAAHERAEADQLGSFRSTRRKSVVDPNAPIPEHVRTAFATFDKDNSGDIDVKGAPSCRSDPGASRRLAA